VSSDEEWAGDESRRGRRKGKYEHKGQGRRKGKKMQQQQQVEEQAEQEDDADSCREGDGGGGKQEEQQEDGDKWDMTSYWNIEREERWRLVKSLMAAKAYKEVVVDAPSKQIEDGHQGKLERKEVARKDEMSKSINRALDFAKFGNEHGCTTAGALRKALKKGRGKQLKSAEERLQVLQMQIKIRKYVYRIFRPVKGAWLALREEVGAGSGGWRWRLHRSSWQRLWHRGSSGHPEPVDPSKKQGRGGGEGRQCAKKQRRRSRSWWPRMRSLRTAARFGRSTPRAGSQTMVLHSCITMWIGLGLVWAMLVTTSKTQRTSSVSDDDDVERSSPEEVRAWVDEHQTQAQAQAPFQAQA
jgi:hypothetical protein